MVQNGCILAQPEGLGSIIFMHLLMCRFQNHPSLRGRRAFFHKMRPDAMRKSGNVTLKPCDKADDAKNSFPTWAINKKYAFSNGFCKFHIAIKGAKKVHIGPDRGPKGHIFHDFACVPLSKSGFPLRAANIFSQNEARCAVKEWEFYLQATR